MTTAFVPVILVACLAAGLTFFTGFGLGTLLMPAFALVFPLPVAVAATGAVHLANNLFKLALVHRTIHFPALWRFGVPALFAAMIGAALLAILDRPTPLIEYELWGRTCSIRIVNVVVGLVVVGFAAFELTAQSETWSVPGRFLPIGGAVSGFLGGLSGHQGALRSAFLIRAGLTSEQFIATGVAASVVVDLARLAVYAASLTRQWRSLAEQGAGWLVVGACFAAFLGSYLGSRLVRKITIRALRRLVGAGLLLIGIAMIVGLL